METAWNALGTLFCWMVWLACAGAALCLFLAARHAWDNRPRKNVWRSPRSRRGVLNNPAKDADRGADRDFRRIVGRGEAQRSRNWP